MFYQILSCCIFVFHFIYTILILMSVHSFIVNTPVHTIFYNDSVLCCACL